MKPQTLITGLAIVAACSAHSLRAEGLKIITSFTMTTYTQNTVHDNGTTTTYAKPVTNTYNTQAILNFLASDKYAEGQLASPAFPAKAQLASTNGAWVVLDKNNNVLADVSEILSATNAGDGMEVISGTQLNGAANLACPTVKTMELIRFTFDDTAIAGGNNISFYLQGLSTKTDTDTTPTTTGLYTETQTGVITGAAGGGFWSNGAPFVFTANLTTASRTTFGDFAPESLAGYMMTCTRLGRPNLVLSFGDGTWAQAGTGADLNADDYCAGIDTYVKTGTNTAVLTNVDIGMLSWLGTTNHTTVRVTFGAASATAKWSSENDSGTITMTAMKQVSNLVPATLAGKTIKFASGSQPATLAFASDGTFTESHVGSVTAAGTYSLKQYSPTMAIIEFSNYTDAEDAGALAYLEVTFTSGTAGRSFYSYYKNPATGANPGKKGLNTFTLQ